MTELVPMPEPWGSGPCSATEGKHGSHMVRAAQLASREERVGTCSSLERYGPVIADRGRGGSQLVMEKTRPLVAAR